MMGTVMRQGWGQGWGLGLVGLMCHCGTGDGLVEVIGLPTSGQVRRQTPCALQQRFAWSRTGP